MDKDEVLKQLQEKYPQNLREELDCIWWYTIGTIDGVSYGEPTFYLLLKDKYGMRRTYSQ